jgi:hypothetical protein
VIGTSNRSAGVFGFSNSFGVVGQATSPGSYAGFFNGNVFVIGNRGAKSAAVPFPDGTRRVLYCMESPELWFDDFGSAKLKRGRAGVPLDTDFAKVIKRGDYRVFLTPEGDCRGLYIRRKSAAGFEVRELMGGKSSIDFSYRIVGRRKDIERHRRFAKTETPELPAGAAEGIARKPPSAASVRWLVARVEKEARRRRPKLAKKGKSSRPLPNYLRLAPRIARQTRGEAVRNKRAS